MVFYVKFNGVWWGYFFVWFYFSNVKLSLLVVV